MNTPSTIDPTVDTEALASEPYTQVLPEIMAVRREEVEQFSLEVLGSAARVLGSLPEIRALLPEIVKQLPMSDPSRIEKLETYAAAAMYAHTLHEIACKDSDGLPGLYEEAVSRRDTMKADINALIQRGVISPQAIRDYTGQTGYRRVAADLQLQVAILKVNWKLIEGKCGIDMAELDRADRLAWRIVRLVGLRDQIPPTTSATAEIQARAMTLFVNCYDDVRRAVTFLRWKHGDADTIAPSLYAGRKHKDSPEPPPPVAQPAPSSAVSTASATTATPAATKPLGVPVPGSNPFMP